MLSILRCATGWPALPSQSNQPRCLFGRGRRELLRGETATSFPNQASFCCKAPVCDGDFADKDTKGGNSDNTNYTVKRIIIDTVAVRPTVKHIEVQRRGNDIAKQPSELLE